MKYTAFCGGINKDGVRHSQKNHYIYLLTKYVKSILWGGGVVVRLSCI